MCCETTAEKFCPIEQVLRISSHMEGSLQLTKHPSHNVHGAAALVLSVTLHDLHQQMEFSCCGIEDVQISFFFFLWRPSRPLWLKSWDSKFIQTLQTAVEKKKTHSKIHLVAFSHITWPSSADVFCLNIKTERVRVEIKSFACRWSLSRSTPPLKCLAN